MTRMLTTCFLALTLVGAAAISTVVPVAPAMAECGDCG